MQQIAQWLEEIGLPEYSERFAENGIDISVVRHLTEQDLKDIGVLLGHRRKMLVAIGNLTDATVATPSALAMTDLPAVDGAERRHLTVMFCDLVGSTALSAKLDPEGFKNHHWHLSSLLRRSGRAKWGVHRKVYG
jgi:SAM domain (Sterile alpha motif)